MVVLTKFSFEPLHSLPWFPVINPISLYTMTSISSLWDLSLPPRKVTVTAGDGKVHWSGSSCTSSSRSAGSTPTGLPEDSDDRWQDRSPFQTKVESQITCKRVSFFPWPPPLSPVLLMVSAPRRTSSPGPNSVSQRGWLWHSEWDISSLGRTADSHCDNQNAHYPHLPSTPSL